MSDRQTAFQLYIEEKIDVITTGTLFYINVSFAIFSEMDSIILGSQSRLSQDLTPKTDQGRRLPSGAGRTTL